VILAAGEKEAFFFLIRGQKRELLHPCFFSQNEKRARKMKKDVDRSGASGYNPSRFDGNEPLRKQGGKKLLDFETTLR
jgi:hypothetical protein